MTNIDDFYYDGPTKKKYLQFDNNFNESLSHVIFHPDTQCIFFGEHFNQPLDNVIWPQKLISLYFGYDFDQPLDHVNFPNSLLTLSLISKFNHPLENVKILDTIDTIELGHMFNQSLTDIKFSNLRMITIGNNNILESFKFPPSLEIVKFYPGFTIPFSDVTLPDNIKCIIFSADSSVLFDFDKIKFPKSLKKLILPIEKIKIVDTEKLHATSNGIYYWKNLNNLPDTLEELTIANVNENIINLPLSLKKIFTINIQSNVCHFTKLPFGCKLFDIKTQNEINTDLTFDDVPMIITL